MQKVVVLNSDFSFLNVVSVKRAFLYIAKGKVSVEKYTDKTFKSAEAEFKIPRIVRFVNMIRQVFKKKIAWSKRNVLIRDKHVCQYCGTAAHKMTIDHILPKSRGGKNTFDNTVAACFSCNNWKDNKTPEEAGMSLIKIPRIPMINEFIRIRAQEISDIDVFKELGFNE